METDSGGGAASRLRGYTGPRTPTGASSLVPPPPWHFSGEVLMLEYLADPSAVAALLPAPLEPSSEARVAAIFCSWQACSRNGEELLDPVRSQFHEFYLALACEYAGRPFVRCPFCWVDAELPLVRGLIQGFPKKPGSIALTRPIRVGQAGPRLEPGARMCGTLAAADRRLAELTVTLQEPVGEEEAPFLMTGPLVHSRIFPSWALGGGEVDELVLSESTQQEVAGVWTGSGELWLGTGPNDEIGTLAPVETLGAYRLEFAETLRGGRLLGPDCG